MTAAPAEVPDAVEPTVATPDPTPTEPAANPSPDPSTPWADPAAAQAEIERLRKENAKDRTNAKAQAAEAARAELAQTIGKALGLVADDTPVDPAALTQQVTESQAAAKQARVELAVFRSAAAAGGDPAALLDSASFLASLADIDPADTAAISEAIASAVEANPRLGAAPADPKAPAPNPAQGTSAAGSAAVGQLTREQVAQMARDGKHAEIEAARKQGRLDQILGIRS